MEILTQLSHTKSEFMLELNPPFIGVANTSIHITTNIETTHLSKIKKGMRKGIDHILIFT